MKSTETVPVNVIPSEPPVEAPVIRYDERGFPVVSLDNTGGEYPTYLEADGSLGSLT